MLIASCRIFSVKQKQESTAIVIVAVLGVSGLRVSERGDLHAEGCQNYDPSMATQSYYGPSVNVRCSRYGHDDSLKKGMKPSERVRRATAADGFYCPSNTEHAQCGTTLYKLGTFRVSRRNPMRTARSTDSGLLLRRKAAHRCCGLPGEPANPKP